MAQDIAWLNTIRGTYYPYVVGMATDSHNNIYIAGNYYKKLVLGNTIFTNNNKDTLQPAGFYAKYSNTGQLLWLKSTKSVIGSAISNITIDEGNNLYLAGGIVGDLKLGNDSIYCSGGQFLAKIDSSGKTLWLKKTSDVTGNNGGVGPQYRSICVKLGKIIFNCHFNLNSLLVDTIRLHKNGSQTTFFISEWDTSGQCEWAKTYGSGQTVYLTNTKLGIDGSGNSYIYDGIPDQATIGTNTYYNSNNYKSFIAKFNPSGQLLWSKLFDFETDYAANIITDSVGNFITSINCGRDAAIDTFHFNASAQHSLLLEFNTDGKLLWGRQVYGIRDSNNNMGITQGNVLTVDKQGNIYKAFITYNTVTGGGDTISFSGNPFGQTVIAKYDAQGSIKWIKPFGHYSGTKTSGANPPAIQFLSTDASENIFFVGDITGENTIGNKSYSSSGTVNPMLGKISWDTLRTFLFNPKLSNQSLYCYPNPSSEFTTVHITMPESCGALHLSVSDINGKKIFTTNIASSSGDYFYQLSTADLLEGVYIISIYNDSVKQQIKFIKN